MKTILAPVDFSRVSKRVVAEAMALARVLPGRVVLMNVVAPPFGAVSELGVGDVSQAIASVAESASKRLEKLRKAMADNGIIVSTVQATGVPVALILHEAKTLAADYIVMGSHGHNALYDLVVGSTANGVMKSARCPVLIVPPPQPLRSRKRNQ